MPGFDPYHKWFGIPPKDQPPHHYRLLGIELFESDPDVIDIAADKHMTYLKSCANGPHSALSQTLLNETAAARLCLLDPTTRAAYDVELKKTLPTGEVAKPAGEPKRDVPGRADKEFDPYHKWLGIPNNKRTTPPHHYRLLGIDLFESDPDVIDIAADKQMTYLKSCATGPRSAVSQMLLNEMAAARLCLLDPKMRAAYNAELKKKLAVANPAAESDRKASVDADRALDPYHRRIGILRHKRSPTLYPLRGVSPGEADRETIADDEWQQAFIKQFKGGPRKYFKIVGILGAGFAVMAILAVSWPWKKLAVQTERSVPTLSEPRIAAIPVARPKDVPKDTPVKPEKPDVIADVADVNEVSVAKTPKDEPRTSVWYVRASAVGGDGRSWTTARGDLQAVIDEANESPAANKQIWVAAGIYRPDRAGGDRTASFRLPKSSSLMGGFTGSESDATQRKPGPNTSVLSGDLNGNDSPNFSSRDDNCFHVVSATDPDRSTILDGFTISGGYANRPGAEALMDGIGGGIRLSAGAATIRNCVFTDNFASFGGGAVSCYKCEATFSDCFFNQNRAGAGGALYLYGDVGNRRTQVVTVRNCMFVVNVAARGGALATWWGDPTTFARCTIMGNTATGMGPFQGGGGIYNDATRLSMFNCVFHANGSSDFGGALNAKFVPSPQLVNCTFVNNRAGQNKGEAIHAWNAAQVSLSNCIVTGTQPKLLSTDQAGIAAKYSCVRGGPDGEGNIDRNPLFVNPQSDFRLQSTSPCINSGNDLLARQDTADLNANGDKSERIPFDLYGRPRFQERIDMGAIEFQATDASALITVPATVPPTGVATAKQNGNRPSRKGFSTVKAPAAPNASATFTQNNSSVMRISTDPSKSALLAEFYAGGNFERKVTERLESQIDSKTWNGWPDPSVPRGKFSVRWTGFIKAPTAGIYQLTTISDDGARVWIDGRLLIDDWEMHATRKKSAFWRFDNQPHAIRVEFWEAYVGTHDIQLLWQQADSASSLVPKSAFYQPPNRIPD